MAQKTLVLIDGMSVLHRAYHAYPLTLSTKDGELTNAVYGFTNILLTVLEKLQPTHVVVTWDVGKPTFRHEQYVDYKGTRQKPDDQLINQIARTQEVVDTLNIPQFGVAGFEADDLIGTLAVQAYKDDDSKVIIVTGDRDTLQVVKEDRIIVWMPGMSNRFSKDRGPQIYDEVAVKAKYNLSPKQIIDLKGLMGDSSDNIPGVRGVGPKTATKLLEKFGSVENIYEKLVTDRDEVVKTVGERSTKLLEDDKDGAFMSKKLATIHLEAPVTLDWQKCLLSDYDREKVLSLFEKLQFRSLANRLPKDNWEEDLEKTLF